MVQRAHIVVVGNEKGGTGKSTVSMHLVVSLMEMGLRVGSIDLDARQATFSRYIENRQAWIARNGQDLPMSQHVGIPPTGDQAADLARLDEVLVQLLELDVIVIDTPGSDHYLSRAGHSHADTLITPLNDSLVDLDVLAKVDPATLRILHPSHYSEMVWETMKQRALRGERRPIDWIVLRNRLSTLDARNKRDMEKLLADLSKRIRFRLAPGLSERVIYRELFLDGLTLLDLQRGLKGVEMRMSDVAARQELRALVDAVGLARLVGSKAA
jgi:chromosome partitioning protein